MGVLPVSYVGPTRGETHKPHFDDKRKQTTPSELQSLKQRGGFVKGFSTLSPRFKTKTHQRCKAEALGHSWEYQENTCRNLPTNKVHWDVCMSHYIYVLLYIYIYITMYIYIYTYMSYYPTLDYILFIYNIYMYISIYIYTHIYKVYIYIYIYIHIYIYILYLLHQHVCKYVHIVHI